MRQRIALVTLLVILCGQSAWGSELREPCSRGRTEFGVLLGYGENHKIPSATKDRFAFDVFSARYGRDTSHRTQVAVETCVGHQVNGADNLAVSATINYRRYFMVQGKTALGFDLAVGGMHLKDKVPELGTRLNFTEQAGLVLKRELGPDRAFVVEYRFCHISNAGIKTPNIGVNTSIIRAGLAWYN